MKRILIVAALALAVAAAGWLAWRGHPRTVQIARAHAGPAADLVYATGFVEAEQPVTVAARITAPVARVLVREGDRVRRGQALVLLDTGEQQALIDQAEAQRRAAEVIERRTLALASQGWVTRAARDAAVASADAARAAARTASARRDQLVVRAEIDGIVTRADVYPGELASPGRVLMTLGNPAQTRITATVDERDITRITPGQPALMSNDGLGGHPLAAHVVAITPAGDPTARAFRVRLRADDPRPLPMGLTLEINVITRRVDHAVLVPAGVVGSDGRAWLVRDGRAHHQGVQTGISGTDTIEIRAGLAAGDSVVVNPPADLAEGERVSAAR